jgi:hypothetical protein
MKHATIALLTGTVVYLSVIVKIAIVNGISVELSASILFALLMLFFAFWFQRKSKSMSNQKMDIAFSFLFASACWFAVDIYFIINAITSVMPDRWSVLILLLFNFLIPAAILCLANAFYAQKGSGLVRQASVFLAVAFGLNIVAVIVSAVIKISTVASVDFFSFLSGQAIIIFYAAWLFLAYALFKKSNEIQQANNMLLVADDILQTQPEYREPSGPESQEENDAYFPTITFKSKEIRNGRTYDIYLGDSKTSALDFLICQSVDIADYYIVVITSEGMFGRDAEGLWEEN